MQIIDLGGKWSLTQAGKAQRIRATVPGCAHTDLLAARRIEEPFYRDNEKGLQWIGETGWVYSRAFAVPASLLERDRVLLRCEGLDTLATIRLNGKRIGRADNMFRLWELDVTRALKKGRNAIEVRFASVIPYIDKRQRKRWIPAWKAAHEVKGGNWVRKMQCNFGWDWGPVLVTCGIWRPIGLVGFDGARLADVHIRQHHRPRRRAVDLSVSAAVETVGLPPEPLSFRVTAWLDDELVADGSAPVADGRAEATLTVDAAELWWPRGMGEQPLYDVRVELRDEADDTLDTATRRIGLRTLRLERKKDRWGESFRFVANGVPFFAKGANWIPADAFPSRVDRGHYARLLESAASAHMNMLRVWGGGIYEDEAFYELCDELGICVWQDFMFACAAYPTFDEAFTASVCAEAEDNVRRLRHHPSVALWCGNNELEQGLVDDEWSQRTMSWADYSLLFDRLLKDVVGALDPERDYWPASPHSPHGDRLDAQNPQWGDAHLWAVWHGKKPFDYYRTCPHRFVSEFGFQSFPEPRTVAGFTEPEDRNVTSYVMEQHQRSGTGNTTILTYLLDWFRLPTSFEATLWLSQILHGLAIKHGVEHWRRNVPRTMGALYWQLNDCWPVASWASVDYHGRWKALHFMARRFYAPLLVSAVEDREKRKVDVFVTSDLPQPCPAALTWTLTDVAGKTLAKGSKDLRAAARRSKRIETLRLPRKLEGHNPRDLLLWLDLAVEGVTVSTSFLSFARPKHLELRDPAIEASVEAASDGGFLVTLEAPRPALWTWLELDGADARLSDNFLHLRPGQPAEVLVYPTQPMTKAEFEGALRVRSLVDTYA